MFVVQHISKFLPENGKQIIMTHKEEVLSSNAIALRDVIAPCNHEEADQRMMLHAKHASLLGHSSISIRTVDTDVVVEAASHFTSMGLNQLFIEFGTGKNFR